VEWQEDGEIISFNSKDVDPVGDQAWTTVKTVLLRLNTNYTLSGRFPVLVEDFSARMMGYDAAVCVQKYEPWIVETYNTSIVSPSTFRIVEKGNGSNSSSQSGNIRGAPIANTGYLNTTGKGPAFTVAHRNSINQMLKDSGRDPNRVPTLTVGPLASPRAMFLLTWTYSTGRFFHQWHWTSWIHRTLPRTTRHRHRTGRCGQLSTIPCRVQSRRRKVVRR